MTSDETVRWRRFVAIGDSFTEGLMDDSGDGRYRGWADRLAGHLDARRHSLGWAGLEYANLAIRGRLLGQILAEQLPAALAMHPDLVSIVGGGNDVLRPGADPEALAARLDRAVAVARRSGADVLLCTGADPAPSPLIRATRSRIAVFNADLWSIARRHGAFVIDQWGMRPLQDRRMWAADRIHLTPAGHERVAQAALAALGLAPDDDGWDVPPTPEPEPGRLQSARSDVDWLVEHAVPWATRRLRRRSSGDNRRPKRPTPGPV